MTLLSLLIPTTPDRIDKLTVLLQSLTKQILDCGALDEVRIHTLETPKWENHKPVREHSIGYKRNRLLKDADGLYVAFIDSDDRVSDDYVKLVLEGIDKGPDCCSLNGIITENGLNPLRFQHSIRHNAYSTNPPSEEVRYLRYPNHLNAIRADIAKQFQFPETMHGEDTDWATQIHNSRLLKTEYDIPSIIYFYDWVTK
jgi:glycosyltransferase involved in cell wall biosynthesis